MPLVRTPMIAPTKIYDRFPTLSPEEAANLITDAIRKRPKRVATTLGNLGQLGYAIAPGAQDLVVNRAYKLFPEGGDAQEPRTSRTRRAARVRARDARRPLVRVKPRRESMKLEGIHHITAITADAQRTSTSTPASSGCGW